MFEELIGKIDEGIVETIFKLQVAERAPAPARRRPAPELQLVHQEATGMGLRGGASPQEEATPAKRQPVRVGEKVGRNDPCPCGSGKKFKKCHGA